MIKFAAGGRTGDFIHSLWVVKHLCISKNDIADVSLVNKGDSWALGIDGAYHDLLKLIQEQSYIKSFRIGEQTEPFIDLTKWRIGFVGGEPWTETYAKNYNLSPVGGPWIFTSRRDKRCEDKVVIHRSHMRQNQEFPWEKIVKNGAIFITSDIVEWNAFPWKKGVEVLVSDTVTEMAAAIASAKLFVGNQSMPFALASALDVPRLCELYLTINASYVGEEKYSKNISWYLDSKNKYLVGPTLELIS